MQSHAFAGLGNDQRYFWLLQVAALQKEIADIDKQVAEAEHMLRFADPGEPLHAELCQS